MVYAVGWMLRQEANKTRRAGGMWRKKMSTTIVSKNTTKNQTLQAAQEYLARGWQPIPIPAGQKSPVIQAWQDLRLAADELPARFGHGGNVGVILGEPSGWLVDVDLDSPEAVILAKYFLPETGMVFGRPGKRGSHYLYACPGAVTKKYQTKADGMIVEIRSAGCQTVFPPSVHPSGETISWEREDGPAGRVEPDDLEIAVARLAAAALLARHWPAKGNRQATALALSGGLLRGGWSEDETCHFIKAVCVAAHDDEARMRVGAVTSTARKDGRVTTGFRTLAGLMGEDVIRTFREWLDLRTGAEPEDWDPPVVFAEYQLPTFPMDVLPRHIRTYIEALAVEKQVPVDLPGMLVLTALATALQKKVIVLVRPGWVEPVNIWTMCALPPGSRKSGTFASLVEPIEKYERLERDRLAPEVEQAKNKRKIAETRLTQLQNDAAKKRGHEAAQALADSNVLASELAGMVIPVIPELIADDITPEAVVRLLADQGGKISVMSSEADILEILAGRYSNGSPNLGAFLKGHAGDSIRVKRIGRLPDYVDRPALSMGISPQPDMLRGLIEKPSFRGRGLLGRFLYSMPTPILGNRRIRSSPVPAGVADEYERILTALLRMEPATNTEGDNTAHVLRMSPESESVFNQFEEWLEPQLSPMGELGSMADWAGKLAGAVARIAGLLHMAEHMTDGVRLQMNADTVRSAVKLAKEYFIPHARAAYAEMGVDPEIEAARYTWDVIQNKGQVTFTKSEVWRWTKGKFERVEPLTKALTILAERNYLRELPPPDKKGVGRRLVRFEVNPLSSDFNSSVPSETLDKSHKSNKSHQGSTQENAWEVSLDELRV
jgi:hypothetical protein